MRISILAIAFLATTLLNLSSSAAAADSSKERIFLLRPYEKAADFKLQRGSIEVWNPVLNTGSLMGTLVQFDGILDRESADVLGKLLQRRNVSYLSLKSPGGLVEPTLKLGLVLRERKVATIVEGGGECYSACALLFLAGERRILGEYTQTKTRPERSQAIVGFHAPYIPLPDGTTRYLQDVKTSSVCSYIKRLASQQSAVELCEYSLATKGMASFSLALGKELEVFTAGEEEVLAGIANDTLPALDLNDRGWLACQRHIAKLLSGNPGFALTPEYSRRVWPCSLGTRFHKGPGEPTQRAFLSRLSIAMGPAELPEDIRVAALEEGAMKLEKLGLKQSDEHTIACQRATLYINATFPLSSSDPQAPQFRKLWGKYCFHRVYDTSTRVAFGVGAVMSNQIPEVLDYIAQKRGPEWFPSTFVPMPPSFPLPKEYE